MRLITNELAWNNVLPGRVQLQIDSPESFCCRGCTDPCYSVDTLAVCRQPCGQCPGGSGPQIVTVRDYFGDVRVVPALADLSLSVTGVRKSLDPWDVTSFLRLTLNYGAYWCRIWIGSTQMDSNHSAIGQQLLAAKLIGKIGNQLTLRGALLYRGGTFPIYPVDTFPGMSSTL